MLILVPTPIGNLEDITLRALDSLSKANVVLCEDTRVAKRLLRLLVERRILSVSPYEDASSFLDSKSFISFHSHNQEHFIDTLTPSFFDQFVVYLSDAGMPCISDPGARLVSYAIERNISFDVLPGACALNVAFCGSGIESAPFIFAGFLPHKKLDRQSKIIQLASIHISDSYSVICYESPHRIIETLSDIDLLLPDVRLVVQKELTKIHQQRYYGTAKEISFLLEQASIRGEWVIIFDFSGMKRAHNEYLGYEEILMLDIPPKIKAKILSKISGKNIKECYEELISAETLANDCLR